MGIALGPMGWTYDDLYFMPGKYFFAALRAFYDHEERKARVIMEGIRIHATAILNSFSKKAIQPHHIMKFRWDKSKETEEAKIRRMEVYRKWAKHIPRRAGEHGRPIN